MRSDQVNALLDRTLHRLALAVKAYNPDQPREPEGSPEGGQWVSVGGGSGDDDARIIVAGGFKKEHMGMTVREFVSEFCVGKNNRIVPGEFWNLTIEELLQAKRDGVPKADRCYKVLNQNRFR